ncbi:MAG: hypothetical protein L6Q33_02010 [Bacteriovoracaceae bacterium]|nr:hypothetical protein [Bacteriovoracaceae bacterium]
MKVLIIMIALIASLQSFGRNNYGFIIESYNDIPQMDYQIEWVVQNPEADHKLLLDCQSFINGLHYMRNVENRWIDRWVVMLSGNDCENAAIYSMDALKNSGPFCLFVDISEEKLDFYSDLSDCK